MPTLSPARIREIAQAVTDDLNLASQPWAGMFTAQRSYWTSYSLPDLDQMRVDVTTPSRDWQPESKGGEECNYVIRVTFQKKVDRTQVASIDTLVDAVSAIADSYRLTETFVGDWDATKAYAVGNFVMVGQNTYRCILAHTNQSPATSPTDWKAVNPIQLIDKSNPTVYSPKEGDTKNSFSAVLDLVFRQWSDPP